ncbi:hypothetical protein P171DRAFT_476218 [Karstenula rhodostoma CBS 690.94]|uniref:Major facilitator superfamily (MFS) profile domain-containing protein n=1 Tax=Karstenula rhodostoma CBS 690.94 TaxID=1392251 RepID=A0A9P4P952_9PLEO|nr:hypothetical protein P171DRAFT_476218 [Karstenula rhodostoma CBS 690.94]
MAAETFSARSSLEEGAPLLSATADTSREPSPAPLAVPGTEKKKPWVWLVFLAFVFVTIVDVGAFLAEPPKTRVFEANLCLRYYKDNDPSKIGDDGYVPEALCKIDEVQQKLAMIFGWQDTFDAIPGLLLAIPFGALADKWGRKWIFVASLVGVQLNSAWVLLICYFRTLPLQLTWFSSAFFLVGGGPIVASTLAITMISDVAPPAQRTNIFLYLTASVLIAEMCAPIMASKLMETGLWLPLLLALAIQQVGVTVGIFFPETLHLRDLPEPRDGDHASIELQAKDEGHGLETQLKHFKSALLLLTSDIQLALVVALFVVNRLGRQALTLLLRYASKRYNWEISKAAYLLSFRAATNLVAVAVFIPIANLILLKYLRLPVHWADLWLMRGSLLITAVGFLTIALAFQPAILILGLLIFNLGTGASAAMRSVSLHVVGGQSSPDVGKLMSLIAVSENIGVMFAGPLLNQAFTKGMDLKDAWLGLPFLGVFVLYVLATIVSCLVSVKDRDMAYVEVATDEEESYPPAMLGRSSSDAGTRLRRSKSASTVHRLQLSAPKPVDSRIAQHHAVAAATTAFVRAQDQAAAERSMKRSSELSRAKSTSSRKSLTSEGSHFPPRESSIRSVNRPKASQASSIQQQSRAPTVTTEKFPSFYPAPGSDRPLSAQPSITFSENARPGSQPRSHRPSATSSVTSQQIRKARSMYYASSVQTGSPIARPPAKYLTTPPPASASPAPEPLLPMLPTRNVPPSPLASPQIPVTVEPGDTINNARDKYLQGFQQQHRQVKHRPSLFLAPFKKRHDRAKSKERSLSGSSRSRQTPIEPTTESIDDFGIPKQKREKRSFSNSLKDKFKKVFRRTSNNTTTMPVQQIEAGRDYFNYQAPAAALSSRTFDVLSPDDETLLRVRSRASSVERMPSPLARPGSQGSTHSKGSNRSLYSETNVTHPSSRVTSWSDSSAGNTLTQRDIKRLTVIHESKDSISSDAERRLSSISLRRKTAPLPSISAFQDPMPVESLLKETSTPVDPKRVFSALMKEIDSTQARNTQSGLSNVSPGAESDVFESSTTKELHAMASRELHSSASRECRTSTSSDQRPVSRRRPNTAQSKASSIRSLGRALKSTIRTVTPIENKSSPILEQNQTGIGSRPGTSASSHSTDTRKGITFASIAQKKHSRTNHSTAEDTQVQTIVTPSARQLEQRLKRSNERWKTPLDEPPKHGSFHYRSHARTISASHFADAAFHTPNTVVGIPALPELEGDSPKETTPTELRATPVNHASGTPRLNPLSSPLSPSIYSRGTDGMSILPNDSVMSFDGTQDHQSNDDSGSAVIIASHAVKSYVIGTPSPRHKTVSTGSSKDWKAWLSREVSELGSSLEGDITIDQGYTPTIRNASPASRHRRELTQIEDDRTTIVARVSIDTRVPSSPAPTSSEVEDEVAEIDQQLPAVSQKCTQSDIEVLVKNEVVSTSHAKPEQCAISPLVRAPAIRKERQSSAHSHHSGKSRSPASTPRSSAMNDRFPFIDTGRRTSINSARFSRSSRSATDSGSSTRSKGTPISKVYSDVSAPVTVNWAPQPTAKTNLTDGKEPDYNKENMQEKVIPITTQTKGPGSEQSRRSLLSPLTSKENRPKSMLSVSSAVANGGTPPLTRYASTSENAGSSRSTTSKPAQSSTLSSSPQRQRMRMNLLPISPKKLTTRPKSAFELRGKGILPLTPSAMQSQCLSSDDSPKKKSAGRSNTETPDPPRIPRPEHSSGIDQDTLRMLLGSPWAISGPSASPRSSMEHMDRSRVRQKLHVKHSSSTLALHREPSPGFEEQTIDALIDERPLSRRSNFSSICGDERGSVTGRITPGQRMAERYLRERSAPRGSGVGTPCNEVEQKSMRAGAMGQTLQREDTPAFL